MRCESCLVHDSTQSVEEEGFDKHSSNQGTQHSILGKPHYPRQIAAQHQNRGEWNHLHRRRSLCRLPKGRSIPPCLHPSHLLQRRVFAIGQTRQAKKFKVIVHAGEKEALSVDRAVTPRLSNTRAPIHHTVSAGNHVLASC